MTAFRKEHEFHGRLVMIGFGCIGQGVLPLLLRHIDMPPQKILIVSPDHIDLDLAGRHGVACLHSALSADNLHSVLAPRLTAGDFLLNLSVNVSSVALIALCQSLGVLYLDTCIEPWAGGYTDPALPVCQRTNYALREAALALRSQDRTGPTALLTHGANPGLVSHLLKQALLNIAQYNRLAVATPTSRLAWA